MSERVDGVVGRRRDEVSTPAVILDLPAAKRNIDAMAARMRDMPAELRPHIKVHKSPELARLQVDAGAIGVCTATGWEAIVMLEAGIDDVLVANQVVRRAQLDRLAAAAGRSESRVTVAVDDESNLREVGAAARAAGVELGVLVEVDVGMGRCGTRAIEETLRLADAAAAARGVRFAGVMGYEGHCTSESDPVKRRTMHRVAMDLLMDHADRLTEAGHPPQTVSAGGTVTYDLAQTHPRITEIQAGSYALMDAFHAARVQGFEVALTVATTVLSRHREVLVVDAGRKGIGNDLMPPRLAGTDREAAVVNEEHAIFHVGSDCDLAVGDRLELVPGYAPTAINLHDVFHVVDGDVVTDLWSIPARYGRATAA